MSRVEKLVASIERFSKDDLPCVLSVPRRDMQLFRDRLGTACVTLVTDEEVVGRDIRQNWRTQQIVKFYAHRLDFADAWLLLDSDMAFIRDFGVSDFVDEEGSVALVASRVLHSYDANEALLGDYVRGKANLDTLSVDEARALADPSRPDGEIPAASRLWDTLRPKTPEMRLPRIRDVFPRSGPELFYLPTAVWTLESLRSLQRDYLDPRRLRFEDLIRYSPWEGQWLGEWEIRRRLPGRRPAESFFLHFTSDGAIERARSAGFTVADFARRYVGLHLAAGHQLIEAY